MDIECEVLFVLEDLDCAVFDFAILQQLCDLFGFELQNGEPICKDKWYTVTPDERIFCRPDEYVYDHFARVVVKCQSATDAYNAVSLLASTAHLLRCKFAVVRL